MGEPAARDFWSSRNAAIAEVEAGQEELGDEQEVEDVGELVDGQQEEDGGQEATNQRGWDGGEDEGGGNLGRRDGPTTTRELSMEGWRRHVD